MFYEPQHLINYQLNLSQIMRLLEGLLDEFYKVLVKAQNIYQSQSQQMLELKIFNNIRFFKLSFEFFSNLNCQKLQSTQLCLNDAQPSKYTQSKAGKNEFFVLQMLVVFVNDYNMNMSYYNRQSQNHNQSNIREHPSLKNTSFTGCPNHPEKPVTHWIFQTQTNEQICYCEKCSIMLASNGFNVVKLKRTQSIQSRSPLKHSTLKNTRSSQIEDFITEINFQIEQLNRFGAQTDKNLHLSEQHYGKLITEVTSYFQQLKNKIEIQKYLVYNKVLSHRAKNEEELRLLRQELVSQIEELSGIAIDIQNNMQAAQSVQQDVYQAIMRNYRNQLNNSYQIEGNEVLQPNLPGLSFPQMPEISMLAENFQILYEQLNRNRLPSVKHTQRDQSVKSGAKSCESSRINTKLDGFVKSSKMIPTILSIHSSDSAEDKEDEAYSFDNSAMVKLDSLQMRRALFADSKKSLPHQIFIRESLNLTEIRQNQEYTEGQNRPQFSCLQQTIPEEMLTSRQSIAEYLMAETLVYSLKNEGERQDTETLLIS